MITDIQKVQILIANAKSFGILLDENPEEYEFIAKEILFSEISKKNKPVLSLPTNTNTYKKKWSSIIKEKPLFEFPQKTSINLPKNKYKIKEIACKENAENLSLVVTSPGNIISKEDITIEKLPPDVEFLFCLFGNETKISTFQNQIQAPKNDKILSLTADNTTLTEKIIEILETFNSNYKDDKEITTLLFALLMLETNSMLFVDRITKKTMSMGNHLIENGANIQAVFEILEKEKNLDFIQITGRLLARTFIDTSINASWSFLNKNDFNKTNNNSTTITSPFLYKLLRNLTHFLPQQNIYSLIWESDEGIKIMVARNPNRYKEKFKKLAQKMGANSDKRFFVTGPYDNFSKAEISLRELMKEDLMKQENTKATSTN